MIWIWSFRYDRQKAIIDFNLPALSFNPTIITVSEAQIKITLILMTTDCKIKKIGNIVGLLRIEWMWVEVEEIGRVGMADSGVEMQGIDILDHSK